LLDVVFSRRRMNTRSDRDWSSDLCSSVLGSSFRLLGDDGVELQRGTVGDSIGQAVGFRWAPAAAVLPPGSEVTLIVSSVRDAAKRLGDELNVTIDPNGNFLRLSLSGTDGPTVAATLNAVAQRYVDAALKLKRAKLSE